MLTRGGWLYKAVAGTLVLIPTGFVVVLLGNEDAIGLRWTLAADQNDRLRVQFGLKQLFDNFPEVRAASTGYAAFLDYFTKL